MHTPPRTVLGGIAGQESFLNNMSAAVCAFVVTFLTLSGPRGRLTFVYTVRRLFLSAVEAEPFYCPGGRLGGTDILKVRLGFITSSAFRVFRHEGFRFEL